jgi:hypothetical protein
MSTSTARPCPETQGARSNYKKFGDEPADHAIGRSRGLLTTKTHLVADGKVARLAMRPDKTARNHHSGQCLAATLHCVQTFSNTA